MRYNQPYDQPSNPDASYVDGNVAEGIQGSIVPASSVEFDQREIVEVITRANVRGYLDFSQAPCAIPDNVDLMQLRKAIEGFIQGFYYDNYVITTVLHKTVFGTGADFPDLNSGLAWVTQRRISSTGLVIFDLAPGQHNISGEFYFYHGDGIRVQLCGAPAQHATVSDFVCSGYSAGQRASDTAANLTMLRSKIPTELHFTQGNSMVFGSSIGLLKDLLVTSDGATGVYSGLIIFQDLAYVSNLAVAGFFAYGIAVTGNMYSGPVYAIGNGSTGIAVYNVYESAYAVISYSNGSSGVSTGLLFDGSVTLGAPDWSMCGNGYCGISAAEGTVTSSPNGTVKCDRNAGAGVISQSNAGCNLYHASASNNGGPAYEATNGGWLYVQGVGSGNASWGYYAYNSSSIFAQGPTYASGASGTTSPAFGVVGNVNSVVIQG